VAGEMAGNQEGLMGVAHYSGSREMGGENCHVGVSDFLHDTGTNGLWMFPVVLTPNS